MSQQFQPVSYMNLVNSFQGMHSQPIGMVYNSQTAFTQVRDSRENMFASNLMPLPPKFAFQERVGRINWRQLMNTDLEKIQKEVDLKSLETLLQNITFAQLDRDDLERLGDTHFIKLFRLSQYSIEYLLYTQNYMESLCKTLDVEYKQTYEKTVKTEEAVRKYQQELKLMRKELKLKQKTLSTYEYLMKLPVEQEQDVIKCRHCPREKPKFFLNKNYLFKHYQRNHPEVDFNREFSDMNNGAQQENQNSINERTLQTTLEKQQQQAKIDQEQLYDKIKRDLFTSLTDNFKTLEKELSTLKDKANYEQIQEMLHNYESKNEQEQKKLQESLNKPAKMLEDLKQRWGEMFQQQGVNMREAIAQSVNDALAKRKDDRDKKKANYTRSDYSQEKEMSQVQEQKIKFFESRINEFDEKFKENEKIKIALEQKVREYERMLKEKAQTEQELAIKLQQEEARRIEEEKLRMEKEKELVDQLKQKVDQEVRQKMTEEQKLREDNERKLKIEQDKIRENEEEKKKQLLKQQQEQEQQDEKLRQKQIEDQEQEKELIKKQKEQEMEEAKKKQQEESKRKQQEEEAKNKQEEEKERLRIEEEERQNRIKQEEEQKKKKAEEEDEEIIVEEEEESEIDDEEEVTKKKAAELVEKQKDLSKDKLDNKVEQQPEKQQEPPVLSLKERISKSLQQKFEKSNLFEGQRAHLKSLFPHPPEEIEKAKDDVLIENIAKQEQELLQQMQALKVKKVPEKNNPLSTARREDLKNVNEDIKGLAKQDAERVNNSLMKKLSDQDYAPYSALIDDFLKRTLK